MPIFPVGSLPVTLQIRMARLDAASASADRADKATEALHDGYQLTAKDQQQLGVKDEDYKLQSWDDLKLIVGLFPRRDASRRKREGEADTDLS